MAFIYSTLSNSQLYTIYQNQDDNRLPKKVKTIHVEGGANIRLKSLETPFGVVTEVSDEDLEHLEKNGVFQIHKKNGHIKVDKKKNEIEKAVSDMTRIDASAPINAGV